MVSFLIIFINHADFKGYRLTTMTKKTPQQRANQNHIANNMFVDSADQNYVVARWCYHMKLDIDFLWNATHCLEKLMKAVLLFNGKSAKKGGHDLSKLYPEVVNIAGNLLPDKLLKPKEIEVPHWRDENSEAFINRLSQNGQADNRYHVFGYALQNEDLYKFDQMVFAIRRLCCSLDDYWIGKLNITFREQLTKSPNLMPRGVTSRLYKLIDKRSPASLRHAALNHNFMFAPNDFEHSGLRYRSSSQNPVLGQLIVRPTERGITGKKAEELANLTDWVINNIQLPRDVQQQFKDILSQLHSQF